METLDFVTQKAAAQRLRLGHRTHSVHPSEPVAPITGDQWLPEALVTIKQFPTGDCQVSFAERKIRPPKVVSPGKRSHGQLSEDDAIRSARRARRGIWDACQSKQCNAIVTVAKRGGMSDLDEVWRIVDAVCDLMKERGWIVGHVAVPELHTGERADRIGPGRGFASSNVGTWHVHIATHVPVYFSFADLHEQMRLVEGRLFGHIPSSPAERMLNVDVSTRRGRGGHKRHTAASIARYLAPYVMKSVDGEERALNRKRYDVSRDGKKPKVWHVRCNPGEVVHPQEAVLRILRFVAPGRTLSSPWSTEIAGQRVVIQSALDWGHGEAPAKGCLDEVTAADLFAVIQTRRAAASEASDSLRVHGAQAEAQGVTLAPAPPTIGSGPSRKAWVTAGRAEVRPVRPPPPPRDPPAQSLRQHLDALWRDQVDDGPPPWHD